jgi:hypothetical protein
MTPEQTAGFFDAGESFVEGTIAAVLVLFWLLVLAMQVARPYMLANLRKFTLRLGADLWWIIYVGLRDLLLVSLFLGGIIFYYPDVVAGKDLPVTGGLANVCAFAVLVLKLTSKGEADNRSFRLQTALLGLGATLYIVPYVLGVQVTQLEGDTASQLAAIFVSSRNTDVSLPLCYLSGILTGILGLVAVAYNLSQTTIRRPKAAEAPEAAR